ncbi:hypothetical protein GGI25_006496 [Coemansia spiralis]|uniref:Uncharacterized protein n=2 Tax=Coemansia TaxID=4863 RepID=A0A9W8G0I7_9FUNG|nr:hypothetical protein EDC05_006535 [Coemansia umbellata]KAJ2624851.1 hypothetical protein GGI26_001268 [Coemansia sp. RSA 1358]KAJ2668051.1 hypothetical protein GGI25_006496 [Coemansia spiralis]
MSNRIHHSHSLSHGHSRSHNHSMSLGGCSSGGGSRLRNCSNSSGSGYSSSSDTVYHIQFAPGCIVAATPSAVNSSCSSGGNSSYFPLMPPSPIGAVPPTDMMMATTMEGLITPAAAAAAAAAANGWCASPTTPSTQCSSRINLAGSWLDLGSDSENEDAHRGSGLSLRGRRKGSHSSTKDAGGSSSRAALANLKELTRRSSMHFRKLTSRSGTNN